MALAGRTLRVPGVGPDEVRRALALDNAAANTGVRVHRAPATLEERFFSLTAGRAQAAA